MRPSTVIRKMENDTLYNTTEDETTVYRKIAGVSPDENIFLNGIVVGKSTSSDVILVAESGILTDIIGGKIKEHGVEKLGKIDLNSAVVKTGLLRRSKIQPRILERKEYNKHNS